jgi:hypothetical protein
MDWTEQILQLIKSTVRINFHKKTHQVSRPMMSASTPSTLLITQMMSMRIMLAVTASNIVLGQRTVHQTLRCVKSAT